MVEFFWKSALVLIATWILATWGFVAISHAKAIKESGYKFTFWTKFPLYLLLAIFGITDVLFNLTWGSAIFLERPKEILFTHRIKRHIKESTDWRNDRAIYWQNILNTFDPGHI